MTFDGELLSSSGTEEGELSKLNTVLCRARKNDMSGKGEGLLLTFLTFYIIQAKLLQSRTLNPLKK